ncbi:murein transglycosylase [Vibrio scophthalmi]|uniref:murein transglycosylase n=1 Tax=Vibrio scophthalmi TaxID=45658 RepID=UPI002FEECC2C
MTLSDSRLLSYFSRTAVWFCAVVGSATYATSAVADLATQRALYDQAQDLLDEKKVDDYQTLRPNIADYPLTPYVDYRAFLVNIGNRSSAEVNQFIERYKTLPFSGRISAPYLDALAKDNQWQRFLEFQTELPRGESYQCHYYWAHYQTGNKALAWQGAKTLWRSGSSIADACDPLFAAWNAHGQRSDRDVLDRVLLVFDSGNGSLLNYLVKQLESEQAKIAGQRAQSLFRDPATLAKAAAQFPDEAFYHQLVSSGMKKLARRDVVKAQQEYSDVMAEVSLPTESQQNLADFIAFRLMNRDEPDLIAWRDDVIARSANLSLLERRIRLAIGEDDWPAVSRWLDALPVSFQETLRWQYWRARAEMAAGQMSQANQRLEAIIGQRNFYSVAAAQALQRSIVYPTSTITLAPELVEPFETTLVRIEELIDRDKITAAKSEWRWLLGRVNKSQREMLAAYASFKGWHHLTVTASIQAKMWDNLEIRFPIAHRWWFNFYGDKHNIDPITLMSLARQESAMDVEARSPVGARGIMQIMPSTAKYTARKYQLTYQGSADLYEVGKNIEIGSHYLKGLLDDYDHNRILAFAAYNAGPNRVKTWRERSDGKLDVFAFIEAIPFKETRGYVQNILMFETYYREVLGEDGHFLSQKELQAKY